MDRHRRSDGNGRAARHADGTTLLELLVALAVLAILTGIAAFHWRPDAWGDHQVDPLAPTALTDEARRRAVASGAAVTVTLETPDGPLVVTALPDGRVVGASALGLDPLSGR